MSFNLSTEELQKRLSWYEKKYGVYIERRGIQNIKNMFRKPNLYEWTILFMIIMSLFIAWAYLIDTQKCRETLKNLDEICLVRNAVSPNQSYTYKPSDIDFKALESPNEGT